jgi:prevent-host-death family protein
MTRRDTLDRADGFDERFFPHREDAGPSHGTFRMGCLVAIRGQDSYDGHMKKAMIAELKNHLSRYLDHVKQGGEVLVFDRKRPVARIVPLHDTTAAEGDAARLQRLEQRGLIRRGKGGLPTAIRRARRAKLRGGLLAELLAERRASW